MAHTVRLILRVPLKGLVDRLLGHSIRIAKDVGFALDHHRSRLGEIAYGGYRFRSRDTIACREFPVQGL